MRIAAGFVLVTLAGVIAALVFQRMRPREISEEPRPYVPAVDFVSPADLEQLPLATRFDWPIGSEHGALIYNAQHCGEWNEDFGGRHSGDDLNGIGGYNTDLGDPVYAIAAGQVIFAATGGPGWGKIVIVMHAIERNGTRAYVQSFHAHLQEIAVTPGHIVKRGERIGSIGTAEGKYFAHLHFEMREFLTPTIGAGYRQDLTGWLNPGKFIEEHRGASADDLLPDF